MTTPALTQLANLATPAGAVNVDGWDFDPASYELSRAFVGTKRRHLGFSTDIAGVQSFDGTVIRRAALTDDGEHEYTATDLREIAAIIAATATEVDQLNAAERSEF